MGDSSSINSGGDGDGGNFFRDAPLTLFSLLSFVATLWQLQLFCD
jgi:hypothetical protein